MKGYSLEIPENCASARLEGVDASYKDLTEVCGRIRNRKTRWAISFLGKVADGEAAVLYKRHNKNLGHRRELGGRKGRYPEKAAKIVLKLLQSAIANGKVLGLGDEYTIFAVSAGKKHIYPRLSPKGRRMRMTLQTSRVEIVLKGSEVPKGVTVTPPAKTTTKATTPAAPKTAATPQASGTAKPTAPKTATAPQSGAPTPKTSESPRASETRTGGSAVGGAGARKEESPVVGKEQKTEQSQTLKQEDRAHEHKHEAEKTQTQEKKRPQVPHQHGEYNKG